MPKATKKKTAKRSSLALTDRKLKKLDPFAWMDRKKISFSELVNLFADELDFDMGIDIQTLELIAGAIGYNANLTDKQHRDFLYCVTINHNPEALAASNEIMKRVDAKAKKKKSRLRLVA